MLTVMIMKGNLVTRELHYLTGTRLKSRAEPEKAIAFKVQHRTHMGVD